MDLTEELGDVQDLLEKAGQRIAGVVGSMAATPQGWGTQQLAYLAEATKQLNRSWALVRAVLGPENCQPKVSEFAVHRIADGRVTPLASA